MLVVGSGSSGSQIADELLRAGRRVYLSVGPHNRPPIRYRGKDFVWWLGVLGEWDARTARGYVTGGGNDISRGQTDLSTTTVRVRYDGPTQKFISSMSVGLPQAIDPTVSSNGGKPR